MFWLKISCILNLIYLKTIFTEFAEGSSESFPPVHALFLQKALFVPPTFLAQIWKGMIFAPLSFCSLSEIKRNLLRHLKPKEGHHIKWGHVSSAAAEEIYQPILYPSSHSIKRLTVHQKKETDLCNCCIGENCAENIYWKAFLADKWKAQAEATEIWCSACRRVVQQEQVKLLEHRRGGAQSEKPDKSTIHTDWQLCQGLDSHAYIYIYEFMNGIRKGVHLN